jgi:hypothetical protein
MTMFGILEVVLMALHQKIQIDRLLFEQSGEQQAILQEKCPLTVSFRWWYKTWFSFEISWLA